MGLHVGAVDHRADTRHHAAAQDAGIVQGQRGGHGGHGLGTHQGDFTERAQSERPPNGLAAPARGAGRHIGAAQCRIDTLRALTQSALPRHAARAAATRDGPVQQHPRPHREVGHALADGLDHPSALMAHHQRPGPRERLVVSMAQARGDDAHPHLARAGGINLHRVDGEAPLSVGEGGPCAKGRHRHARCQITGFLRLAASSPGCTPGHHWAASLAWMALSAGSKRMAASI